LLPIVHFINHRNFLLTAALIIGMILGEHTFFLPSASVYILAIVMVFATVDFSFSAFRNYKQTIRIITWAFFLNYLLFGGLLVLFAYYVFPESGLWLGCVLLAASPPGPSVLPFSAILKGNIIFGVIGLFGLHLIALFFAPLILFFFTGNNEISPVLVLIILLKTIIIPLILSRPLRHKKIYPIVSKMKGTVINWGFFLIVVPIVGQSMAVMSANPQLLWQSIALFVVTMFILAGIYNFTAFAFRLPKADVIASTFFLTTKSSAFAAVVVFQIADKVAGVPAAVHAFFVTIFFLVYPVMLKTVKRFRAKQLNSSTGQV